MTCTAQYIYHNKKAVMIAEESFIYSGYCTTRSIVADIAIIPPNSLWSCFPDVRKNATQNGKIVLTKSDDSCQCDIDINYKYCNIVTVTAVAFSQQPISKLTISVER